MKQIKIPIDPQTEIMITISGKTISLSSNLDPDKDDEIYTTSINAIESLIMAHVSQGIRVDSTEYVEGIKIALEAISNNI